MHAYEHKHMHTCAVGVHTVLGNFLIAVSHDDQIGWGLNYMGQLCTINGLNCEEREVENKFVHFYNNDFYYRWWNKRVNGRALAIKHAFNTTLFCFPSCTLSSLSPTYCRHNSLI